MYTFVKRVVLFGIVICSLMLISSNPGMTSSASTLRPGSSSPVFDSWFPISDTTKPHIPGAIGFNPDKNDYLAVWTTQIDTETFNLDARIVHNDRSLGNNISLDSGPSMVMWFPAIAYSPLHQEYLVVYMKRPFAGQTDIWAKLISWNGTVNPSAIQLTNTPTLDESQPAVAYNSQDDEYLVVFETFSKTNLTAIRIDASNGSVLSTVSLPTAVDVNLITRSMAAIAYDPAANNYLIVYEYRDDAFLHRIDQLRGIVVSHDLTSVSVEQNYTPPMLLFSYFKVALGPDGYLLVWIHMESGIFAARLGFDGANLTPGGQFEIYSGDSHTKQLDVDVAYSNQYGFLTAWTTADLGTYQHAIYGCAIPSGQDQVGDCNYPIDTRPEKQDLPLLACAANGSCLMIHANQADYIVPIHDEVVGNFIGSPSVYLPIIIRGLP